MKQEWKREPDTLAFKTSEGYHGVINRNPSSMTFCGYVGVDKGHVLYEKGYKYLVDVDPDTLPFNGNIIGLMCTDPEQAKKGRVSLDVAIQVHGGITFSDFGYKPDLFKRGLWYFGFDCNHHGDYSPMFNLGADGVYRNFKYVRENVEALSKELRKYA